MDLPFLTHNLAGIGGAIKRRAEDFVVHEIPLYEACGTGEHVYCEIQKINQSTFDLVRKVAAALNVPERAIGYAGMKDARAVTRQFFSIQGVTEDAVFALQIPNAQVLWVGRHSNKLRLGHLAGNRFQIKIRDVLPTDVLKARAILDVIERRGMPNYFGEQRFGRRGNNHVLGAALIRGDNIAVLRGLLGSPDPNVDDKATREARRLFDEKQNDESMKHWPRRCGLERRVLARLMKTHKPNAAVRVVDEKLKRLWVSALQSKLFNDVVAKRLDTIDAVLLGDVAYKHDNGACFRVTDPAAEQPRCTNFEISPSGPLVGYRVTLPESQPLEIEQDVFAAAGLKPDDFKDAGRQSAKGARRPLRVKPAEVELTGGADEHGPYVGISFALPAGSFATVLLGEIMKAPAAPTEPAESEATEELPEE